MVKLRMARSQTLFFALFFREFCKPFVDDKEIGDPLDGFFADAAEEVFFRQHLAEWLRRSTALQCAQQRACAWQGAFW